jgi:hypothetical protein
MKNKKAKRKERDEEEIERDQNVSCRSSCLFSYTRGSMATQIRA